MVKIRKACENDGPRILELLAQIGQFHHQGRPDIFKADAVKYSLEQVLQLIANPEKPILVAVDDDEQVLGYAMCQVKESAETAVLKAFRLLYLDDLCVDEKLRHSGLGGQLLEAVKDLARSLHCQRVELNVWEFPGSAGDFYQAHGFKTQHREMEFWL